MGCATVTLRLLRTDLEAPMDDGALTNQDSCDVCEARLTRSPRSHCLSLRASNFLSGVPIQADFFSTRKFPLLYLLTKLSAAHINTVAGGRDALCEQAGVHPYKEALSSPHLHRCRKTMRAEPIFSPSFKIELGKLGRAHLSAVFGKLRRQG